jgi:hypothetical protein
MTMTIEDPANIRATTAALGQKNPNVIEREYKQA